MMALLFGCKSTSKESFEAFRQLNSLNNHYEVEGEKEIKSNPLYSFSSENMSLLHFSRWFSDTTGQGLVFSSDLSKKLITIEAVNLTASELISLVSRQLNNDVARVGHTFFIGQLKIEDRGILVRKIPCMNKDELKESVSVLLSENGRTTTFEDGVLIVSDRESVLSRISSMLDMFESIEQDSWVIQLYCLKVNTSELLEAGVNLKSTATLTYDIAKSNLKWSGSVNGLFNFLLDSNSVQVQQSPCVTLRDGKKSSWSNVRKVPIERKNVSPEGNVETVDFDIIEAGFKAQIEIRESNQGAILSLFVEDSTIVDYISNYPVVDSSTFTVESYVDSNKTYLLGELRSLSQTNSRKDTLFFKDEDSKSSIQIWARIFNLSKFKLAEELTAQSE